MVRSGGHAVVESSESCRCSACFRSDATRASRAYFAWRRALGFPSESGAERAGACPAQTLDLSPRAVAAPQKGLRQEPHVAIPFPERRNVKAHDVEPVEQIRPEAMIRTSKGTSLSVLDAPPGQR